MPEPLREGDRLPDVALHGPQGPVSLDALRGGRPLVVAFYTEDRTPLCTAELSAFAEDYAMVEELHATMAGISTDAVDSQRRFLDAQGFPFPLLSDPNGDAARAFGVLDPATQRSHRAIFVTDARGVIVKAIPFYNPHNPDQYAAVFQALGLDV